MEHNERENQRFKENQKKKKDTLIATYQFVKNQMEDKLQSSPLGYKQAPGAVKALMNEDEIRFNKDILEMMEYVWSIGGGLGEIPKRFNERVISPEMLKEAPFREKLKLLKEHQHNKENHSLRCEWLLRLSIAQSFKTC